MGKRRCKNKKDDNKKDDHKYDCDKDHDKKDDCKHDRDKDHDKKDDCRKDDGKKTTRKTIAKKMAVKNKVRVKVKALVRSPEKEKVNNFFISKSTCTKKGQSRKSRQPLTFIYPPKMELNRIISETRKWICYSSGGLMDCIRIMISLSFTGLLI